MIECLGRILGGAGERVTGRICIAGERESGGESAARILLFDGRTDPRELADSDAVGIVAADGCCADAAVRLGCLAPVFVIGEEYAQLLPYILHRIAILDCPGQRLYVDPSIDVIKRYFGSLSALPPKRIPWLCMNGKARGCDGIVTSVEGDEESVYDGLCELSDRFAGARIVARIRMGERLSEQVRGALRAAVWGRIALACDAKTPALADRYIEISRLARRSLEREGREFNGFTPKGIWVSTPALLLYPPNGCADFFVLDGRAIINGFLGTEEDERAAEDVIKRMADFALRTKEGRVSLCAEGRYAAACAEYLCSRNAVKEIYAEPTTANRINGSLQKNF